MVDLSYLQSICCQLFNKGIFNQCVVNVQSRKLSQGLRYLLELNEYSKKLSVKRLQVQLLTLIAVECCQLFNQGIFNQYVVSCSTKGFSINALSVIQPSDFQSMCCQLFNQGIINQCVVSLQPRDFQSMCCQLFNQGSYLNGCVQSTSKNIFFVTNSC